MPFYIKFSLFFLLITIIFSIPVFIVQTENLLNIEIFNEQDYLSQIYWYLGIMLILFNFFSKYIMALLFIGLAATAIDLFYSGHNFASIFIAIICLFIGYHFLKSKLSNLGKDDNHGTADWATNKELIKNELLKDKGLILGKTTENKWVRYNKTGHLLTCAPTGAGKGVSVAIPNLLTYQGSVFVNDIKGENYIITSSARKNLGQRVILIDPFNVTGERSNKVNWLDIFNEDLSNATSTATVLADMIIIREKGDESHWNDAASNFLKGIILHIISKYPKNEQNMQKVRELVTLPQTEFEELLNEMQNNTNLFGVIKKSASILLQKSDKERSGVLSTIHRNTDFLDDPNIVSNLSESDFNLTDLKDKPTSLYLVIPPEKLSAYSRFTRSFIGLSIHASSQQLKDPNSNQDNLLFMLDEFSQLGYMKPIEDAISLIRGYGITLWLLIQDLSQLKAIYPKWQSFLSNVNVFQTFGGNDHFTNEYISKMLGTKTIISKNTNKSQSAPTNLLSRSDASESNSAGTNEASRNLMNPDELRKHNEIIVFINGLSPITLEKVNYLKEKALQKLLK